MKQISFWAKQHPVFTRWLIVVLYLPLNLLAINTGKQLREVGIEVSTLFLDTSVLLTLSAILLYKNKASYYYRKSLDVTLIAATFMIVCFYGNQLGQKHLYIPFSQPTAAVTTIYPSLITPQKVSNPSLTNKQTWSKKEIRQSVRAIVKKQKTAEGSGSKAILIVVTILVSLLLVFLLTGLSCSIACNGSEALAYIVFLLGTFGIVFGAVRIIKSIQKKKPRAKSPPGV